MVKLIPYADLTWPEVARLPRSLPLFIPLGRDEYDYPAVARQMEAGRIVILPPVPYGFRRADGDPSGELSVRPGLLRRVLRRIQRELKAQGFERIIFLNGHGNQGIRADGLEVLGPQGERKGRVVPPGQDPLHVGVHGRIQVGERVPGLLQEARGHRSVGVVEEAGVPTQAPQDAARKEKPEEDPPAPGVPLVPVEGGALAGGVGREDVGHATLGVDEGKHPPPEHGEVALEPAGAADPGRDVVRLGVPEPAGRGGEQRPAATVQGLAPGAGGGADQLEQLGVSELPVGRDP